MYSPFCVHLKLILPQRKLWKKNFSAQRTLVKSRESWCDIWMNCWSLTSERILQSSRPFQVLNRLVQAAVVEQVQAVEVHTSYFVPYSESAFSCAWLNRINRVFDNTSNHECSITKWYNFQNDINLRGTATLWAPNSAKQHLYSTFYKQASTFFYPITNG